MDWFARIRRLTKAQGAAMAVAVVTVTVVALSLHPSALAPDGPSPSPTLPQPSPSEEAAGPPWAQLDLPPLARIATLEPTRSGPAGVATESSFTLTSLTGEPPDVIASRLAVDPPVTLALANQQASTVELTTGGLEPNRQYRFTLHAPDGSIAGSWAFRVQGPVGVLSTLPGNASTNVPMTTGIEVSFNQDGVADMADHFSISPNVAGRFERHGLTQVFVPGRLEPKTLYTVTITAGLARSGADLVLPRDVVFRFETEDPRAGTGTTGTAMFFGREVIESSPAEAPVMAVVVPSPDETPPAVIDTAVDVYRLASVDDAARDLTDFLAQPHWAQYTNPHMSTTGLPIAVSFSGKLELFRNQDVYVLRFPDALPEGWYIVEIGGTKHAQAMLQVTPVSAWVSVLMDKTVVWVNDVTTGRPLVGATVTVAGGPLVARSDATGLAVGGTPAELIPPAATGDSATVDLPPLLKVTSSNGHMVLVPFGVASDAGYRGEWSETVASGNETYWSVLFTDRGLYRTTDHIDVWGYLRNRDNASVPASVEVRLVRQGSGTTASPIIVAATVAPDATGTFTTSLSLVDIPTGWYEVQAVVDGSPVVSRWLEVSIIRKPPYQLRVDPDQTAVISGATVRWSATATFFDGSAVDSLPVTMTDNDDGSPQAVTTDASGVATMTAKATGGAGRTDPWEDPRSWGISANPTGPEGGELWTSGSTLVFPTAYQLTASGAVTGRTLDVTGSLHLVDLEKVTRELAAGTWSGDAAGAVVPGKRIEARVTELILVKRQVGQTYDFIEKVVRPEYEYDTKRTLVKTVTVASDSSGAITFSLSIPDPSHAYEIVLTTTDDSGRLQQRTIQAGSTNNLPWWTDSGPVFQMTDGSLAGDVAYRIGGRIVWQIADGGRIYPSSGNNRYLYLVAQRGLVSATIADASTFRHTFAASDAPGIFIIGVRFTGSTYASKAATWANFDTAQRSIKVTVTSDRARYRPGDEATISVTTTDEAGRPISAGVVIQAVDEKLYAIGGASTPTPLDDLYRRVDSGIVRLTATHQVPTQTGPEGEGGSTGGGGPRSDFRDTLFFTRLMTDGSGKASTTVRLSDDLTSWHVAASAVTPSLQAGVGELKIPVGLPFFVEATTADTYLATDRPAIQLRAFGEGLKAGDPVEFTVASTSLGLAPTKVSGIAFQPVRFPLPPLKRGTQAIDISARALSRTDTAGKPLTDRLLSSFQVIDSRLTEVQAAYGTVGGTLPVLAASTGITTYTFSDAGRGRYLSRLIGLAQPAGARLDRILAQGIARHLLIDEFGRDPASLPSVEADASSYPVGQGSDASGNVTVGVGLLPYSGVDPWLAVRVACEAPHGLDIDSLATTLAEIRDLASAPRDLTIAAEAGLACLGEPVLDDLRQIQMLPDLTPMERIYLTLGFEAAGDDSAALDIERGLLGSAGERLGTWVRLRVGSNLQEIVDATALMAVVAAGLGDPLAPAMADYVDANPGKDSIHDLDLAAFSQAIIARTPTSTASFAYTVDGERHVVTLQPGEALVIELTPAQRTGLRLEGVTGQVGVTMEAQVSVDSSTLRPSADLTLERKAPTSPIPAGSVVAVDFTATFGKAAPDSRCYDVVEKVPSGLAPLTIVNFVDDSGLTWPSSVEGQRVVFCAFNESRTGHVAHLRYLARVVSEGTYTWEPAVMQLAGAPEVMAFVPPTSTVIGRP